MFSHLNAIPVRDPSVAVLQRDPLIPKLQCALNEKREEKRGKWYRLVKLDLWASISCTEYTVTRLLLCFFLTRSS